MKKIIDFLSSMQLAIYLLLILLILTVLGAIIPQEQSPDYYVEKYPEIIANTINLLLLNDVYHSLYFYVLTVFIVASLLTCTLRRFNKTINVFKAKESITEDEVRALKSSREIEVSVAVDELAAAARKSGFRSTVVNGGVYATRNRWARMGEVLVHFGLILLVAAGIGWSLGEVMDIALFEGQTILLPDELNPEIELECIEVNEEVDPNTGKIIDYKTKLAARAPGRDEKITVLEVNKPLEYAGVRFYQSEMSIENQSGIVFSTDLLPPDYNAEKASTVKIYWQVGASEGDITALIGSMVPLGDTGYTFLLREYFDRFIIDKNGISNMNPDFNPTIVWAVADEMTFIAQGFSFAGGPEFDIVKYPDDGTETVEVKIDFVESPPMLPAEGHHNFVVSPGTTVPLGGSRFTVNVISSVMGGMGGPNSGEPELILTDKDTKEELAFTLGRRMGLITADGSSYMIRFLGEGPAPYSGLTASKDPGLGIFYASAIILTLGVIVAMFFRHETILFYPKGNKLVVGGRSNKGNDMFLEKFEGIILKIIGEVKRGEDA